MYDKFDQYYRAMRNRSRLSYAIAAALLLHVALAGVYIFMSLTAKPEPVTYSVAIVPGEVRDPDKPTSVAAPPPEPPAPQQPEPPAPEPEPEPEPEPPKEEPKPEPKPEPKKPEPKKPAPEKPPEPKKLEECKFCDWSRNDCETGQPCAKCLEICDGCKDCEKEEEEEEPKKEEVAKKEEPKKEETKRTKPPAKTPVKLEGSEPEEDSPTPTAPIPVAEFTDEEMRGVELLGEATGPHNPNGAEGDFAMVVQGDSAALGNWPALVRRNVEREWRLPAGTSVDVTPAVISFNVNRGGEIVGGLSIVQESSDPNVTDSAVRALEAVVLPPLPDSYLEPEANVTYHFRVKGF